MYLASSLSDQQNDALWVICTFSAVFVAALFVVGVLGLVQRNSQS